MSEDKVKLGRWALGIREVDLYWRKGTGGSFNRAASETGIGEIAVGIDEPRWEDEVSALLHETAEFAMYDMRRRFNPDPDYSRDHGNYLFVLTHEQFSEAMARVAWFAASALPRLAAVYNKEHKKKRKGHD